MVLNQVKPKGLYREGNDSLSLANLMAHHLCPAFSAVQLVHPCVQIDRKMHCIKKKFLFQSFSLHKFGNNAR